MCVSGARRGTRTRRAVTMDARPRGGSDAGHAAVGEVHRRHPRQRCTLRLVVSSRVRSRCVAHLGRHVQDVEHLFDILSGDRHLTPSSRRERTKTAPATCRAKGPDERCAEGRSCVKPAPHHGGWPASQLRHRHARARPTPRAHGTPAPHAEDAEHAASRPSGTPGHARDAPKLLPTSPSRYTCAMAKKSTPSGTPALVALDRARVAHTVHAYEHDPSTDLGYGLEAAAAIGVPPAQVFKTLLALADGRLTVGVVPVDGRLDLKALARAVGAKKAEMADPAAAERATGYVVGGISPLGQKQRLRTVVDESALDHVTVYVSAGRRGLDVGLAPADLVALTDATTAALSRD